VADEPRVLGLGVDGLYTALARRGHRERAAEFGLEYRSTDRLWSTVQESASFARLDSLRCVVPSVDTGTRSLGCQVRVASTDSKENATMGYLLRVRLPPYGLHPQDYLARGQGTNSESDIR
jgi:hypothetical protein